jgi:hypothetical protein
MKSSAARFPGTVPSEMREVVENPNFEALNSSADQVTPAGSNGSGGPAIAKYPAPAITAMASTVRTRR